MAGEWKETTLGAIAAKSGYGLVDGPFGSNLPASCYTETGIPVIRGSNLTTGVARFRADEFVYVSQETANENERSLCRPGDIVFTKKGTIGQTGFVPDGGKHSLYLLSSNQMKLTVELSVADPLFVYYFVSAPSSVEKILRDSEATGVPKTNVAYLREFPISLPPLAEQKAIAAVLGALDDKIELDRRMNATLEAMARALFQSWFVDFDPVRAKLDGRNPDGLDKPTAALFPAAFQDSPLGPIPKGWEVRLLGDVIELAYGKPLKAEDRKGGSICVYGANGPVGSHDEKLVSGPGIVVGRKGNPGVVTWAHGDFYPIDTTFYVVPTGDCRSLHFLYYALSLHDLANLSADSAVPGLNRNHAYMSKQVIPKQKMLEAFDAQVSPIFASIHANAEQSRTLATLRDTLLPKLLSGDLAVPPALGKVNS
jgi:type I restriction enzyme S subunit